MRIKNKQKGISRTLLLVVIIVFIISASGISYGAVEYRKTSKTIEKAEQLTKEEKYSEAIEKLESTQDKWLVKSLGIKKQEVINKIEKNKQLIVEKEKRKKIEVTSPNGGEKWQIGGTYDILWEASGMERVTIFLRDCSNYSPCKLIAISPAGIAASQGKYSWKITVYEPGDKYQIEIQDEESSAIKDQSDNYFSIVLSENLIELEGKLVVGAEGKRSESWGIEVEKGPEEYVGEIVGLCMIPTELKSFKDKQVSVSIEPRVTCFSTYEKMGRLLKWKPLEKFITVISPNGGEEWIEGNTYKIKWESDGVDKVNIEYGNGKSWFIVRDYPADAGEYSWTPTGIIDHYEGFFYPDELNEVDIKILIFDAESSGVSDFSDNHFSIVSE